MSTERWALGGHVPSQHRKEEGYGSQEYLLKFRLEGIAYEAVRGKSLLDKERAVREDEDWERIFRMRDQLPAKLLEFDYLLTLHKAGPWNYDVLQRNEQEWRENWFDHQMSDIDNFLCLQGVQ